MKNTFLSNKLVKILLIILILMMLFYFAVPNYVSAASISLGGILIEPFKDLILSLGDLVMLLINKTLYNLNDSLIYIDNGKGWLDWLAIGIGAVFSIVLIATGIGSVAGAIVGGLVVAALAASYMPDEFYLPYYTVSPQEIFANQIYFLDVNFFNPNEYDLNVQGAEAMGDGDKGKELKSTAMVLRSTISSWYFTMLTIAAIGFAGILLYIAFKIIITSNSEEKAKYKERIKDWVVGLCLLASMHYIMVFSVSIVQSITNALAKNLSLVVVAIPSESFNDESKTKIKELLGNKPIQMGGGEPIPIERRGCNKLANHFIRSSKNRGSNRRTYIY